MIIGQREAFLLDLPGRPYANIESITDELRSTIEDMDLSEIITHVYPSLIPPSSIVIGIAGNDEDRFQKVDERVMSKIIEICEKMKIERHILRPIKITKTLSKE